QKVMDDVAERVERALREAQENGRPYLMFIHGHSTSYPGRTTARSVVRGFMRTTDATALIERAGCIQHRTVFVAKIRPKASIANRHRDQRSREIIDRSTA